MHGGSREEEEEEMIEEVEELTEEVEEESEVVGEEAGEETEVLTEEEKEEDAEEMIEEVEPEDVIEEVVTEEAKEELEEIVEEVEEVAEEEEGTFCYKRVHRDNDTKCHFDIGEFVGRDCASFSSPTLPATAATSSDGTKKMLVAWKSGEPVMKILQPGAGEWVEHRYAEDRWGWTILDVYAFEERLYAVTTHGRIAEVEFAGDGGVNVELLESEVFEEEEETAWGVEMMVHHIFDVDTDTDSHVLEVAADARGTIRKVTVYW